MSRPWLETVSCRLEATTPLHLSLPSIFALQALYVLGTCSFDPSRFGSEELQDRTASDAEGRADRLPLSLVRGQSEVWLANCACNPMALHLFASSLHCRLPSLFPSSLLLPPYPGDTPSSVQARERRLGQWGARCMIVVGLFVFGLSF